MKIATLFDSLVLALLAFGVALGVVALVVAGIRRRRARLLRLAEAHLVPRLAPVDLASAGPRAVRLGLVGLLAALAFAGPRWGDEPTAMRGEGVDVVLALDASLSMLATDERPNRLERMKQEVRRYRDLARGDRVALLAFAGRSYILTPLTVDDGAIELFLDNLDPSIVGQAGSSLARTIAQGTDLLLATKTASDRALVILSDGEAFEAPEEIAQAAQRARDSGVYLVTVGFGTAAGSTIPIGDNGRVEMKRDENNQVVVTHYNAETLRAVAGEPRGTFIDAGVTDKAARIRAALQSLHRAPRALASGTSRTQRFQWFLWPAFLLLAVDTWVQVRRRRRAMSAVATAATVLATASCTWSGTVPRQAAREFNTGRYAQAAALYKGAIARGDARLEMAYNLGTALVAGDSIAAGIEALERSGKSENADLRFRSLFNAGLGHLKRGLAAEALRDSTAGASFTAAVQTYKQALLLKSQDLDAKWNYELALRKQDENGGGGGGGGGGNSDASNQNNADADAPQAQQQSGGLGQQQAEQLLNAAAREERGVQGRKQKDARPKPPSGGKDW